MFKNKQTEDGLLLQVRCCHSIISVLMHFNFTIFMFMFVHVLSPALDNEQKNG